MIVLYVLLAIVAMIVLLLNLRVHLIFNYRYKASVTLRILFVRMDAARLVQKYLDRKKDVQPQMVETEPKEAKKKRTSGIDLIGFTEFLLHIGTVIRLALREHFEKTTVYLKELRIAVGTDDAAKTALLCGGVYNAANAICALLQHFSKFRCDNRNLSISPVFTSDQTKVSLHLVMSTKMIHLIGVFLRSYLRFFEGKDVQNERNSIKTSH